MTRRYYIVPHRTNDEGGIAPDVPQGIGWSGTPDIGRGCYVIVTPNDLAAPMLGTDVDVSDLDGLTDSDLHDALPIEIAAGITDDEIEGMAAALGFEPVPVERLLRHKVGGA